MKYAHKFFFLLIFCFLLNELSCPVYASKGVEVEIPADFDFKQSDCCSEHPYFHQATANSEGMFLVCSHYIEPVSEETYKRQYIDLYGADGVFVKEFSFCTSQVYAAELTGSHIHLYFYGYCITIDWRTGEYHCYDQPDVYISDNESLNHLRQEEFSAGQWQYVCKRTFSGYTQLIRDNGEVREVVIKYPGLGLNYVFYITSGVVVGLASIVILVLMRRKRYLEKKDNTLS